MTLRQTERVREEAKGLDMQPPLAVLETLLAVQKEAAAAVGQALPALAGAAELAAETIRSRGRLA